VIADPVEGSTYRFSTLINRDAHFAFKPPVQRVARPTTREDLPSNK